MIRDRSGRFLALAALLLSVSIAGAQDLGLGDEPGAKVTVGAPSVSRDDVPAGMSVDVRIPLTTAHGWHVYAVTEKNSIPTQVEIAEWPAGLSEGGVEITPEAFLFGAEGYEQMVHEGDLVFALTVDVAEDAEPGERTLSGIIRWMACDEGSCLPPAEAEWSVTFDVAEPSKARLGTVIAEPAEVAAGGSTRIRLPVKLADEWHIYGLEHEGVPTTVTVSEWPEGLSGGAVSEHPAAVAHDNFGITELIHEGEVTFSLNVDVAADTPEGTYKIAGVIEWMTCDASMCLPTESVPFEVDVVVGAQGAGTAAPVPPAEDEDGGGLSLGLLIEAMGFGFLTLLTPCVFPMLPITVSFFAKQKGPALPRTVVYGAGWIFTIVVIGLIFASALDAMARTSWFNLAIGLFFIVLAVSLFGMFDLRLPGGLSDWSTKRSSKGGYVGAFFMAVTLALTSFSCSVPFLGIMFRRFEGGDYVAAVVALTVYAFALALPFMVCSLFPSLLNALPRAGSWMNAVKVTMGFVELGLAFKFLRVVDLNNQLGILSREFVIGIWVACSVGAALYLLGYIVLPHDTKSESIGVVRLLFALLFMSVALYLFPGVLRKPLAPSLDAFVITFDTDLDVSGAVGAGHEGGAETAAANHLAWVKNDWDGTLERARERGVPALFDFTGLG